MFCCHVALCCVSCKITAKQKLFWYKFKKLNNYQIFWLKTWLGGLLSCKLTQCSKWNLDASWDIILGVVNTIFWNPEYNFVPIYASHQEHSCLVSVGREVTVRCPQNHHEIVFIYKKMRHEQAILLVSFWKQTANYFLC